MDDVRTNVDAKGDGADFHLPLFITAGSIAEKLNWAHSLQRLFRQHVQTHPIPGWTIADGDV
jgi:hypothetical protein